MLNKNLTQHFYKAFQLENVEDYEITDDKILRIMAAICWSYSCTGNDFSIFEVYDKKGLTEAILQRAIEMAPNNEYIYSKVREIFGQVEEDEE